MPTLSFDGVEVTVPPNTNLVEAAKLAGKDVPIFCYHPQLSIAANCRMCLVHGSSGGKPWPKAMPACQMLAADGMEIDTESPKTQAVRKGVLEFLLINHPLDCPVCDKAGECMLQDNFFEHSNRPSRFKEHKEEKLKTYDIGPQIIFDGERCINCTRCIRFMDEVAGESQLAQINRGDRSLIAPAEGKQLDHPYAMNTVDLCPVGALLGRDFRFQVRAWFLQGQESVCSGCARGCNTVVDASRSEQQVHRIRPRDNPHVNGPWMCDDGRWTYHQVRERRFTRAMVREGGAARPVPVEQALRSAKELLWPHFGTPSFAVVGSARLTSEDHFVLAHLNRQALRAGAFAVGGAAPWKADALLKLSDRNPNRRGALAVHDAVGTSNMRDVSAVLADVEAGKVKALLLVGTDLPVEDSDRLQAALKQLDVLVVFSSESDVPTQLAQVAIPTVAFTEMDGLWVNAYGRVQRVRPAASGPGEARQAWQALRAFGRHLDVVVQQDSVEQVLGDMAMEVPLFKGLTHMAVGNLGVHRGAGPETHAPRRMGEGKPPDDFQLPAR
jgi:NADH-quinone oxidoreductase subunit G